MLRTTEVPYVYSRDGVFADWGSMSGVGMAESKSFSWIRQSATASVPYEADPDGGDENRVPVNKLVRVRRDTKATTSDAKVNKMIAMV